MTAVAASPALHPRSHLQAFDGTLAASSSTAAVPALSALLLLRAPPPVPQGRSDGAPRRVLRRWCGWPSLAVGPRWLPSPGTTRQIEPCRWLTARLPPSISMYDIVICCSYIFSLGKKTN
jgi:hypothetical protein